MNLIKEKIEFYKRKVKLLITALNLQLDDEYKILKDELEFNKEDTQTSSRRKSIQIQKNTLLEEQKLYEGLANELNEIKLDRLKRFSDLKNAQKKLCTVLDETNEPLAEPTLNNEDLDELEERVKKLAQEKDARLDYLKELEVNFKKILKEHRLSLHTSSSLNYLDVFKVFTKEDIANKILSVDKINKYRQSFENVSCFFITFPRRFPFFRLS